MQPFATLKEGESRSIQERISHPTASSSESTLRIELPARRPRRTTAVEIGIAIWIVGSLIFLVREILAIGYRAAIVQQTHVVADKAAGDVFNTCQASLGIDHQVQLRSLPEAPWPFTFGLFRPVVVDSEHLASTGIETPLGGGSPSRTSHVSRHDCAVLVMQRVCAIVYWWHPCRSLFDGALDSTRERICDDTVLSRLNEGGTLARYLVESLEETTKLPTWAGVGLGTGNKSSLETRIEHLLNGEPSMIRTRFRMKAAIAFAVLFLSVAAANFAPARAEKYHFHGPRSGSDLDSAC